MTFNFFGSASSLDLDCMVYLPELPDLEESKRVSKEYNQKIEVLFGNLKKANTNLAVLKDGVITEVFKGTVDEVNNSIFLTYNLHPQKHPLMVGRLLPRDNGLKLLRAARIILSFYSRTIHRPLVKQALQGDLTVKIECLKQMDLSMQYTFDKNQSALDVYKTVAFQLGQVLGLYSGQEFYSKEAISEAYPELAAYLNREVSTLGNLENSKREFLALAEREISNLSSLVEPKK